MQINPDPRRKKLIEAVAIVSIVSIHADQSRLQSCKDSYAQESDWFQSYQFMQINPDQDQEEIDERQEISFNRINSCRSIPTTRSRTGKAYWNHSFNRINSCRSIPTKLVWHNMWYGRAVSIVSIHADQSRPKFPKYEDWVADRVSIVSIHADQSRLDDFCKWFDSLSEEFQSYQFMQINPDINLIGTDTEASYWFQSYQFMQINPDRVYTKSVFMESS